MVPTSTDWRVWAGVVADLFGIVERRDTLRSVTANCLDNARENGLIR
jgi:hypothetical protein